MGCGWDGNDFNTRDGGGMGMHDDGTNIAPSSPSHPIPILSFDGIPSRHNSTYSPAKFPALDLGTDLQARVNYDRNKLASRHIVWFHQFSDVSPKQEHL